MQILKSEALLSLLNDNIQNMIFTVPSREP